MVSASAWLRGLLLLLLAPLLTGSVVRRDLPATRSESIPVWKAASAALFRRGKKPAVLLQDSKVVNAADELSINKYEDHGNNNEDEHSDVENKIDEVATQVINEQQSRDLITALKDKKQQSAVSDADGEEEEEEFLQAAEYKLSSAIAKVLHNEFRAVAKQALAHGWESIKKPRRLKLMHKAVALMAEDQPMQNDQIQQDSSPVNLTTVGKWKVPQVAKAQQSSDKAQSWKAPEPAVADKKPAKFHAWKLSTPAEQLVEKSETWKKAEAWKAPEAAKTRQSSDKTQSWKAPEPAVADKTPAKTNAWNRSAPAEKLVEKSEAWKKAEALNASAVADALHTSLKLHVPAPGEEQMQKAGLWEKSHQSQAPETWTEDKVKQAENWLQQAKEVATTSPEEMTFRKRLKDLVDRILANEQGWQAAAAHKQLLTTQQGAIKQALSLMAEHGEQIPYFLSRISDERGEELQWEEDLPEPWEGGLEKRADQKRDQEEQKLREEKTVEQQDNTTGQEDKEATEERDIEDIIHSNARVPKPDEQPPEEPQKQNPPANSEDTEEDKENAERAEQNEEKPMNVHDMPSNERRNGSTANHEKVSFLLGWLGSEGAMVSRKIHGTTHLKTTARVPATQLLLSIPDHLLLHPGNFHVAGLGQLSCHAAEDSLRAAVGLAVEMQKGSASLWAAYFRTLPSAEFYDSHYLVFAREALLELYGNLQIARAARSSQDIISQQKACFQKWKRNHHVPIEWSDVRLALARWNTGSIFLGRWMLVPGMDLLQQGSDDKATTVWERGQETLNLRVVGEALAAGTELVIPQPPEDNFLTKSHASGNKGKAMPVASAILDVEQPFGGDGLPRCKQHALRSDQGRLHCALAQQAFKELHHVSREHDVLAEVEYHGELRRLQETGAFHFNPRGLVVG
mmetsp:Transcript_89754/g.159559  ORF Transcript_89754/g.159559 Transcript_89754/m.159559 type:complete len:910 (+) Transcript_89754:59-2788(+)|eukprot:CAMPEP_0197627130 /NCGR_PEP_ID=MMETSP1338-20131121/5820_1 /TAXON_ID=43686 ORGANISM="Pelagodinium beii, Strain RCC1491" /NCGR_SAMPLE_ID=MMETSP1338 /ASSEMBLY_ACC=CAM_ASM_000754 /LENGTH=909 /DNA_ID=CAMNT_0043197761 /DNA_START=59 /DNA_END=2788 /DNA_ORIENTATION=-